MREISEELKEALSKALKVTDTPLYQTAPKRVYLQISDESEDFLKPFPEATVFADFDGVTWCADSVMGCEVEYVRVDLILQPDAVRIPTSKQEAEAMLLIAERWLREWRAANPPVNVPRVREHGSDAEY